MPCREGQQEDGGRWVQSGGESESECEFVCGYCDVDSELRG